MQISIQARNFRLTNAISSYVKRRLSFALKNRDEQIQRISVRLSDINGPRGGEDKCCHIQVVIPNLANVVIEDIEIDLYAAIDGAVDRVRRTVDRRITRQRDIKRTVDRSKMEYHLKLNSSEIHYLAEALWNNKYIS